MVCANCGRTQRAGSRFCGGCGRAFVPQCPGCGADTEPDAGFCTACGARLEVAPPLAPEATAARKVVTLVFADLIGSVALHERLDAESARGFMRRYHEAMSAVVRAHGGRVVQLLGDGVLAAFGVPRVAEDDAIRAVRAGVGMQRAFRELLREHGAAIGSTGLRLAVNTGEIVVGEDENSVIGDPTNVAARLQQEGRDGDVIVGETTQRLVGDLVTLAPLGIFALRGRAESVRAFRVVSLEPPPSARAAAFVGRDAELRRLTAVYDAAVTQPGPRLAVLLGSPGLGKSRLLAELARRTGERATVCAARCDSASRATFAPLVDALRQVLRVEDASPDDALRAALDAVVPADAAERGRIAAGLAALFSGAPCSPEETFFAVRRLIAALGAARPVVLIIDDVHWAEPLLLDLVEHLAQWSTGVPLLVLVAGRPELREVRASLATVGPLVADVVTLGGLDAAASMQLAAGVAGGAELPAALVGRVLATSEGNPLFLAELVRMLLHDGTLRRDDEGWVATVEAASLDMPPSIHVLLAARIERLRPDERRVLERAAVVGRQFSRGALAALLPAADDLDRCLEVLRRGELIEADSGWFFGEPALRFHHALIRDAAYRRGLKETRAELHERLAGWIAARTCDAVEHEETRGWHLEQAYRNRCELGLRDANTRDLGERASRHLGAAGRRALARDDLPLAASLLGRALDGLEPDDATRAELALDWCEALLAAGEVTPAVQAVAELGRLAGSSERLRAWHTCFAGQLAGLTDPQSLRATADSVAAAAPVLAAVGDAAGEAKAHSVHALALARLGRIGACEIALDLALAAARRAGDRRRANAVLAGAPIAALWGPGPVTRASGRCLDVVRVLRITQGAPAVEAVALRCQAVLETLRGRGDAARRMMDSSRRLVEELGVVPQVLECDAFTGLIELLQGNAAGAEPRLRTAYAGFRARGLGIDAARAAALLGRALLLLERVADAEAMSAESEALAGDDLKAAIAWRGVRAEALARRGEIGAAIELARAAVALAADTDALLDHADARRALAAALRAAGHEAGAQAEDARAVELWTAKGATLMAAQAGSTDDGRPPAAAGRRAPHQRRVRRNAATDHDARLTAALAARDTTTVGLLFCPDLEVVHQSGRVWGYNDMLERFTNLMQHSPADALTGEPLATLGDDLALCRRRFQAPQVDVDGLAVGEVDWDFLIVIEADAAGRARRVETIDGPRLAEAIARLYERYAATMAPGGAQTRAAATARAVRIGFEPNRPLGDWAAADVTLHDRRRIGLGTARGVEAIERGAWIRTDLATDLGIGVDDVLALRPDGFVVAWRMTGTMRNGGGRFENQMLMLRTFGADGSATAIEFFDIDDAESALARFHERVGVDADTDAARTDNAATRAVARMAGYWNQRNWDAAVAQYGPGYCLDDRRALVGVTLSGDEFLANLRMIYDLEESRWQFTTLATRGESLALQRVRLTGHGRGGAVEFRHLSVTETDAAGRYLRTTVFDEEAEAEARDELEARFAAQAGSRGDARKSVDARGAGDATWDGASPDPLARWWRPTSATAARDRLGVALANHNWAAMRAGFAAEARLEDRRALVRAAWDVDTSIAWMRQSAERSGLHIERRPRAVFGDRLTLEQQMWRGAIDGSPFEIEMLALIEVDAEGLVARIVNFDADDVHAAHLEAYRRWMAIEPALAPMLRTVAEYAEATRSRDLDRVGRLVADDVVINDQRRTGHGVRRGRDAYLEAMRAWNELTSELSSEVLVRLVVEPFGSVMIARLTGILDDGGVFERLSCNVSTFSNGRFDHIEFYEIEDVERALARFEALRPDYATRHLLQIPTNTAMRVGDRLRDLALARDWPAIRELCSPRYHLEDRRPLMRFEGDRDVLVENSRQIPRAVWQRASRTVLATTGDRLALKRLRWVGAEDGRDFEIESLEVTEVDADGRLLASVIFGVDERAAAAREMLERYCRGEGTQHMPDSMIAFIRAMQAHDLAGMRAALADDFVFIDHRRTGVGEIAGADAYMESFQAVLEQSEDCTTEVLYHVAVAEHGSLSVGRMFGTLRGGGPFESFFVRINQYEGSRNVRTELFEVDDLERARACFAELGAAEAARRAAAIAGDER